MSQTFSETVAELSKQQETASQKLSQLSSGLHSANEEIGSFSSGIKGMHVRLDEQRTSIDKAAQAVALSLVETTVALDRSAKAGQAALTQYKPILAESHQHLFDELQQLNSGVSKFEALIDQGQKSLNAALENQNQSQKRGAQALSQAHDQLTDQIKKVQAQFQELKHEAVLAKNDLVAKTEFLGQHLDSSVKGHLRKGFDDFHRMGLRDESQLRHNLGQATSEFSTHILAEQQRIKKALDRLQSTAFQGRNSVQSSLDRLQLGAHSTAHELPSQLRPLRDYFTGKLGTTATALESCNQALQRIITSLDIHYQRSYPEHKGGLWGKISGALDEVKKGFIAVTQSPIFKIATLVISFIPVVGTAISGAMALATVVGGLLAAKSLGEACFVIAGALIDTYLPGVAGPLLGAAAGPLTSTIGKAGVDFIVKAGTQVIVDETKGATQEVLTGHRDHEAGESLQVFRKPPLEVLVSVGDNLTGGNLQSSGALKTYGEVQKNVQELEKIPGVKELEKNLSNKLGGDPVGNGQKMLNDPGFPGNILKDTAKDTASNVSKEYTGADYTDGKNIKEKLVQAGTTAIGNQIPEINQVKSAVSEVKATVSEAQGTISGVKDTVHGTVSDLRDAMSQHGSSTHGTSSSSELHQTGTLEIQEQGNPGQGGGQVTAPKSESEGHATPTGTIYTHENSGQSGPVIHSTGKTGTNDQGNAVGGVLEGVVRTVGGG